MLDVLDEEDVNMKTIKMTIELTYNDEVMHGDDPESIDWFYTGILMRKHGEDLLMLHSNEIGDTIGEVKVLEIED